MYVQYWTDYLADTLTIARYTCTLGHNSWLHQGAHSICHGLYDCKDWVKWITAIRAWHCGQNRLQISDCVLQLIPKVSRIHPGFSQQNETLQVKPPTNAQRALRSSRGTRGDIILEQWLQGFAAAIATVNMDFLISCACEKCCQLTMKKYFLHPFFLPTMDLEFCFSKLPFHMGRRLVLWECVRVGGRLQTLVLNMNSITEKVSDDGV